MGVKNTNAKYVGKYILQVQKKGIIVKKKMTIKLYMEGNSGQAVGKILGIGKNTCL